MSRSEELKKALENNKKVFIYRNSVFIGLVSPYINGQSYLDIDDNSIVVNGLVINYDKIEILNEKERK